jgi:putative membrane protein
VNHRVLWLVLFAAGFAWSAIGAADQFTWALEVFPAVVGLAVLAATAKRYPLSSLTMWCILVHCYVLFVGGHYTYAEVPLFNWIRDTFHHARNNYDKVGHFMQGFVPAMIAREVFLRRRVVREGAWLAATVVAVCMAISVSYEFLEWFVAIASGQSAEAFLGTQGDPWDTQSDMLLATIGALVMVSVVAPLQDRFLRAMEGPH